ncbi:hypothetical protein ACIQF5_20925 [Streptomyces goshikiensis]|uniref:hypothetical protein n=1 Tax=Streptomyces goshikiensis TaxID=1942 RepID=UPI003829D1FE
MTEQDIPTWLQEVWDADRALGNLHRDAEQIADRRALAIDRGVAEAGRGGRDVVASRLGTRVGAVDKAIARARGVERPGHLPYDLLDRLLALELAEVRPLTRAQWQGLRWLVRAIVVDVTWLDDPATLLADEMEAAELDGIDTKELATTVRSWTRPQTVAVLETLRRLDDTTALPTVE